MANNEWTPEREDHLAALASDGKTFAEIAKTMGVTRNAVAGKLSRMDRPEEGRKTPVGTGFRATKNLDMNKEATRRGIAVATLQRELINLGAEIYREEYEEGEL